MVNGILSLRESDDQLIDEILVTLMVVEEAKQGILEHQPRHDEEEVCFSRFISRKLLIVTQVGPLSNAATSASTSKMNDLGHLFGYVSTLVQETSTMICIHSHPNRCGS